MDIFDKICIIIILITYNSLILIKINKLETIVKDIQKTDTIPFIIGDKQ